MTDIDSPFTPVFEHICGKTRQQTNTSECMHAAGSHPSSSCLQTTPASSSSQSLPQTDPQTPPRYTSTLPSSLERPPCRRTEPGVEKKIREKKLCKVRKPLTTRCVISVETLRFSQICKEQITKKIKDCFFKKKIKPHQYLGMRHL